ncbi:unnamed protein product, partial [marine sediment metagenome]
HAYKQASQLLASNNVGARQMHNDRVLATALKGPRTYACLQVIEQCNSSPSTKLLGQNSEQSNRLMGMIVPPCLGD